MEKKQINAKINNQQNTLPLNLRAEFIFETFVEGTNSKTLNAIRYFLAPNEPTEDQLFFLWGNPGSGKSHLLQAAAHYVTSMGETAFYLCLNDINHLTPSVLDQLECYQLICLDNIDAILNKPAWQEQLFLCLNLVEEFDSIKILLSANDNLHQLKFNRTEIFSRLISSCCYQVQPLYEQDLIEAFKTRAAYRQIPISDEVIQYLYTHVTRDSQTLFSLLNELDRHSLQQKKLISIPFVKQILETQTT